MGITTRNDKVNKKNSSERFSYYVQKGLGVYSERFDLFGCFFFDCETSNWLLTIFERSSTNPRHRCGGCRW